MHVCSSTLVSESAEVLAVPLAAMLKIILGSAPGTRPIAKLMGGD